MPDLLAQIAQATDPAEQAALIAEFTFGNLPEHIALVARRCVILHWFDLPAVQALSLAEAQDDPAAVYGRLAALPFIESVPWGLAYHDLTRQGLLQRYVVVQPDILISAARLVAPAFAARQDAGQNAAEAFYCYIVAGQSQEAIGLLDKALDTLSARDQGAALAYYFKVQDEAESLPFIKPLARSSYHWTGRFLVHYYGGDRQAAIADLDKVIEQDPQDATAFYNRGLTYYDLKDYAAALADYARAIELDPQDAQAYNNRGLTYYDLKDNDAALADYARAIELDPQDAQAYNNRGLTYYDLKDCAAALADYARAIELDPQDAAAYSNRGTTYYALKDYSAALADYARAIELDPTDSSPVYGTACVFALQHDVGQACTWLGRAIQMSSENIEMARTDTDFDSIRDTPEFQALLNQT